MGVPEYVGGPEGSRGLEIKVQVEIGKSKLVQMKKKSKDVKCGQKHIKKIFMNRRSRIYGSSIICKKSRRFMRSRTSGRSGNISI